MKKFLIGLIITLMLAVVLPTISNAQTCYSRKKKAKAVRNYQVRGYQAQRPSFYRRHRNVINIAAASGGGALIGGLLGGRRSSMLKGAIVGAGAGALYTYVLKPKKRTYYR
jgi:hypothetical protein